MPLLSLPSELLLDIIGCLAASKPPTHNSPHIVLKDLASTCQRLRSLSITFIYSSIDVWAHTKNDELFNEILESDSHIAECIRDLTISAPSDNKFQSAQGILKSCTKLRTLFLARLSKRYDGALDWDSKFAMLQYLAPESKMSLQKITLWSNMEGVLAQLMVLLNGAREGQFGALRTVDIEAEPFCRFWKRINRNSPGALKTFLGASAEPNSSSPKLESVQTLKIEARLPWRFRSEEAGILGVLFAGAMPCVRVLDLKTSAECIYSALSTYATLGSHLTELTITSNHGNENCSSMLCGSRREPFCCDPLKHGRQPHHFCAIIPKLSKNLTKFVVDGGHILGLWVCHQMFGTAHQWPRLDLLRVECRGACRGFRPELFRATLEQLSEIRQQASMVVISGVKTHRREYLFRWGIFGQESRRYKFIAPLSTFSKIDPDWVFDINGSDDNLEAENDDQVMQVGPGD